MRFTDSFSALMWDPPATADVLSGLLYNVTVINNNTSQIIIIRTNTNKTHFLLPPHLQPCQYYTAEVTVFSSQHHNSTSIRHKLSGGECSSCSAIIIAMQFTMI